MTPPIEAILFDVNGTLRASVPCDADRRREKIAGIRELAAIQTPLDELDRLLTRRMQAYRAWARENCRELSETDIWLEWMLPEQPSAVLREVAPTLHQLWREATGIRTIYPEAKDILLELFRRGYHLGIASNTLGKSELTSALRGLEIAGLFETIVLSSDIGERKPRPAPLVEAARRIGIDVSRCAYVGNRADRDLTASKAAGFGKAIILPGKPQDVQKHGSYDATAADLSISRLEELLDIFPAIGSTRPGHAYDASLSTMWARHNLPGLPDFFESARRLGFSGTELNHQIDSSMLEGADLHRRPISSVHEPCPADVSTDLLKQRDWQISSRDEERRRHGVEAIKRSIDLAAELGLPVIVVHAGMVSTGSTLEQELRRLFNKGCQDTEQYRRIQAEMAAVRGSLAGQCMDSVWKSLHELLAHASGSGVHVGLENRFHYYDIPNPDEMKLLLQLAGPEQLGFVYDVGHAQHLDRLGFYPHQEWLRRFAARIIEVHLHDVRAINDHLAPGLGDVDFRMVASYLPEKAIRTLEVQSSNTPDQIRVGLEYLAECGCIRSV